LFWKNQDLKKNIACKDLSEWMSQGGRRRGDKALLKIDKTFKEPVTKWRTCWPKKYIQRWCFQTQISITDLVILKKKKKKQDRKEIIQTHNLFRTVTTS
jgi:hypothetical protein